VFLERGEGEDVSVAEGEGKKRREEVVRGGM